MVGLTVSNHNIYPRSILGGLKCIFSKIFVIVLKVKGVCIEPLTLLPKLVAAYRCDKTTVHTARQKSTDGHIGEHLHLDSVCD